MKRDYLNGTDYTVEQKKGLYHFNSDTELLGRFVIVKRNDTVLDIGCASGALLLYCAKHHPSSLCGIDLFDEVIESAGENLAYNGVEAELIKSRVQDFKGRKFSLIVCNPPYFNTKETSLINPNPYLAAARHETFLKPDELFASAQRLLADQGRFCIVHRASRIHELFETASAYGMRCTRMKIAYYAHGKTAVSAAMEFRISQERQMVIEPPAYMDDRNTFDERG
jgi:tRNA1(Val) A37 N6-methylase TrmN6